MGFIHLVTIIIVFNPGHRVGRNFTHKKSSAKRAIIHNKHRVPKSSEVSIIRATILNGTISRIVKHTILNAFNQKVYFILIYRICRKRKEYTIPQNPLERDFGGIVRPIVISSLEMRRPVRNIGCDKSSWNIEVAVVKSHSIAPPRFDTDSSGRRVESIRGIGTSVENIIDSFISEVGSDTRGVLSENHSGIIEEKTALKIWRLIIELWTIATICAPGITPEKTSSRVEKTNSGSHRRSVRVSHIVDRPISKILIKASSCNTCKNQQPKHNKHPPSHSSSFVRAICFWFQNDKNLKNSSIQPSAELSFYIPIS